MKANGYKKAWREARTWANARIGNTYKIMIDLNDGKVWCDIFTGDNWKKYSDPDIYDIIFIKDHMTNTSTSLIDFCEKTEVETIKKWIEDNLKW